MDSNSKVLLIRQAIEKAKKHESKLSEAALQVPSFTSIKIRHLLNNLGAISERFLEVGTHMGGTFCSTVYGNKLKEAVAIDNYSEFNKEGQTKQAALDNMNQFLPETTNGYLLEADCFLVKDLKSRFDLYIYDGLHSESAQQRGVTHFLYCLNDEFILVVDDWQFPGVETGTRNGIKIAELEVLFEQALLTNEGEAHNQAWHNGIWVALLKQKK